MYSSSVRVVTPVIKSVSFLSTGSWIYRLKDRVLFQYVITDLLRSWLSTGFVMRLRLFPENDQVRVVAPLLEGDISETCQIFVAMPEVTQLLCAIFLNPSIPQPCEWLVNPKYLNSFSLLVPIAETFSLVTTFR